MPWNLMEIDAPIEKPDDPWPIGSCFRVPLAPVRTFLDEAMPGWRAGLSIAFIMSGREYVWAVVMPSKLPSRTIWVPDIMQGEYDWTIEHADDPNRMTVTPKINLDGIYTGSITNGKIIDDLKGRTYEE